MKLWGSWSFWISYITNHGKKFRISQWTGGFGVLTLSRRQQDDRRRHLMFYELIYSSKVNGQIKMMGWTYSWYEEDPVCVQEVAADSLINRSPGSIMLIYGHGRTQVPFVRSDKTTDPVTTLASETKQWQWRQGCFPDRTSFWSFPWLTVV